MKVLVAHNRYSSAQPSGENTIVDTEMAQLTAAGVEIVPFIRSSDEIADLPMGRKLLLPASPIYARAPQRDLAALIEAERPDVMHVHNPYPLLSPWIIRTAHAHGVPVIQTIHNYRHVCAAATFFRDGHICHDCVGKAFPTPAIAHKCYRGSTAQSVVMATALTAHRGTWHSVDRFIALANGLADYLRRYGIAEDRISIKPNSLPDPGPVAPLGSGFLFVGRLEPEKGIDLLLDAWRMHPDGSLGTLRIVGDGPLRSTVEAACAERSDLTFDGPTDSSGVREAMRAAAVVISASMWQEPLTTVIIEALSNGRPVIGTALGGTPYLIGDAGWVVEPTAAAMAEALPRASAEAPTLAPKARQRYEQTFTPEIVIAQLIAIYEQTASARSSVARTPRKL